MMRLVGTKEVLVQQDAVKEKSAGGIILTASVQEDAQLASVVSTVIDMTDDLKNDPDELLKIGDRVVTPRYFGTKVFLKDKPGLVVQKRVNILAVLSETDEDTVNVR
jgi:co-chaperonin GroES (HSP10)